MRRNNQDPIATRRRGGRGERQKASIPSMCFITPTFRRDFQQFALQRRTMAAFAPDIPHVVIVDEEG